MNFNLNILIIMIFIEFTKSEIIDHPIIFSCQSDETCSYNFINASCVNNKCLCKNRENCMKIETNNMKFVRKIGENCNRSDNCKIENSQCSNGKCVCSNGFVESSIKKDCLQVAKGIHSNCIDNNQCQNMKGVCTNNKCTCENGTFLIGDICLNSSGIGDNCLANEDCYQVKNSRCFAKKCDCLVGFVSTSSVKCLLQAEFLLSACEDNFQCTSTLGDGSECLNNTCQCKEIYHYKQSTNECVKDLFLGDFCGKHEDCHQPGNEPSRLECLYGECKCRYPYYEEDKYCLSAAKFSVPLSSFLYLFLIVILYQV